MKIKYLIILLFSSFINYSEAQEIDSVVKSKLDTIIVEAVRIETPAIQVPFSVDLIDAHKTRKDEPGRSLDELLNVVPGIFVSNRNNPSLGDRIIIRGVGSRASFGVRGIKIILDNIPLTMPDGQSQLSNLDFGTIGTIEVIRGPSSSLYGNASGGIINIKTENSEFQTNQKSYFFFHPKFLCGSYDFSKIEAKLTGVINDYSYHINLSNLNSEGYRNHSAVRSYQINSIMNYNFSSALKMNWVLNYYNSPYELNPGSLNKTDALNSPQMTRDILIQQGAGKKTTQFQTGVSGDYNFNPQQMLDASVYFVTRDILNPIVGRIINIKRFAGGIRTAYHQKFTFKNFNLNVTSGIDFEIQIDDRIEFVNLGLPVGYTESDDYSEIFENIQYGDTLLAQDENVVGIGPFIQSYFSFLEFTLLAGLRYDNFNFTVDDLFLTDSSDDSGNRMMEKLSPLIGINYRLNNLSKIFFNFSTTFQTPTTSELSNRPDGLGGFNPDLMPEDITSFEVGFLRYGLFEFINLNISAFYMNFKNMLIPYQIVSSEEIFFSNAGEAENLGLEISLEIFPFKNLSTIISYSSYNFKFKDYLAEYGQDQTEQLKGNEVPGIPSNKITCEINFENSPGFFASIKMLWIDNYFTNDFNGPEPGINLPQSDFMNDSYTDIGLRLGYSANFSIADLEIFSGVNNLFDIKFSGSVVPNAAAYRYFEPSPERNWYAGIRLTFPRKSD